MKVTVTTADAPARPTCWKRPGAAAAEDASTIDGFCLDGLRLIVYYIIIMD
jgi:hypothetical protein